MIPPTQNILCEHSGRKNQSTQISDLNIKRRTPITLKSSPKSCRSDDGIPA